MKLIYIGFFMIFIPGIIETVFKTEMSEKKLHHPFLREIPEEEFKFKFVKERLPCKGKHFSHIIGNSKCYDGFCGTIYPMKCLCGGLVHASWGSRYGDITGNYIDDMWISTECDLCGKWERVNV